MVVDATLIFEKRARADGRAEDTLPQIAIVFLPSNRVTSTLAKNHDKRSSEGLSNNKQSNSQSQ